jgi:glyoxalase/bleomycin resistance protein/dioxygenase superfamily protein
VPRAPRRTSRPAPRASDPDRLFSARRWFGPRYGAAVSLNLFAGVGVSDFGAARVWYARLLGAEPSLHPHATEAVWELAEHRYLFILEDAERAGQATHTIFVDDFDTRVADIAARGIEPDERVTYPGKARKAIYRDRDGNEISFGGAVGPAAG